MFLFYIVHSFQFGKVLLEEAVIAVVTVFEVPSSPSMPWWISRVLELLGLFGVLNLAGLNISGCPVLMITLFFKKSFFLWKSLGSTIVLLDFLSFR